ncbi:MAG: acylphosphatase [Rhodospirillaceae bacterium]|nr:acylphosphatase [Rhodospirillaceae bacterium]
MSDGNTDNKDKADNVIPFRKAERSKKNKKRNSNRHGPHDPTAPQFPHYDRVVRLGLRGLVRDDAFIRWLVEEAVALQLDGWAKNQKDGDMDVLLAGEIGDVRQMMELLRVGPRPVEMLLVEEKILHGDEPLWSGFHHLSPSEV